MPTCEYLQDCIITVTLENYDPDTLYNVKVKDLKLPCYGKEQDKCPAHILRKQLDKLEDSGIFSPG